MSSGAYGGADRHADLAGLTLDDHPQYGMNLSGLLSARPAPGRAGRLYFATDNNFIYEDSGTTWTAVNGPSISSSPATTQAFGDAAIAGAVGAAADIGHKHGMPALASTVAAETAFGVAAAVGTGLLPARNDHTHGTPAAPTAASVGALPIGGGTLTGSLNLSAGTLSEGGNRVYSAANPPPVSGMTILAAISTVTGGNGAWPTVLSFVAPATGRAVIWVRSTGTTNTSVSLDGGTTAYTTAGTNASDQVSSDFAAFTGLTPGATYNIGLSSGGAGGISMFVEG